MTASTAVTTGTLVVPDARLYYEVRGAGPLLVLVGAPMNAASFAAAADQLATTNTVLTTDPRGHFGSPLNDPDQDSTVLARAEDLAQLITHLGAGPAVVFGSSGGAVTALALAQTSPDLVTTVVAHEPPVRELLPDAQAQRTLTDDIVATYATGDVIGAWRKFFAQAAIPIPEPMLEHSSSAATATPSRSPANASGSPTNCDRPPPGCRTRRYCARSPPG
ncbi:alpha/beta fold hydrolase [Nocardia fluminea]|uniref:alpha/beta fold hydrolase n=1 Tax=Nocardia fluminea TaxID=134984 RepID=UPI003D1246BA